MGRAVTCSATPQTPMDTRHPIASARQQKMLASSTQRATRMLLVPACIVAIVMGRRGHAAGRIRRIHKHRAPDANGLLAAPSPRRACGSCPGNCESGNGRCPVTGVSGSRIPGKHCFQGAVSQSAIGGNQVSNSHFRQHLNSPPLVNLPLDFPRPHPCCSPGRKSLADRLMVLAAD